MPLPRPTCLAAIATLLVSACSTSPGARPESAAGSWAVDVPAIQRPEGETAEWWFRAGAAQAAERGAMAGNARNVILFVGDGMSLTTVAAARILAGQRAGQPGEEHRLSWEHFPATALSRTYNTDLQTPDSAGTMTAMATGAKARAGVISVGQAPRRGDCAGGRDHALLSLWELAAASGLRTGVVTTARLTHATPAATFAHSPDRNWERDNETPATAREAGCRDIASQLVDPALGRGADVLMGGGRHNFLPATQPDPEYPRQSGKRNDGRDLVGEWQRAHPTGTYAWNAAQLSAAPMDAPLLALFEPDHMRFEHDRAGDAGGEPSLADMTRAAIERLQVQSTQGYVLLVEAGRIDHAHHYGNAHRALVDTVALSDAVQAAVELTSPDDTLVMVTADHSHTLTFAGYPARGNPILDKVRGFADEDAPAGEYALDATGRPYTTLGYANGPGNTGASASQPAGPKRFLHPGKGFKPATGRPELTAVDTRHPDYMQEALVPLASESHGGDDVGVWARGPGSAAVRGSIEQNALFHLMVQATPRLRDALCERGLCNAQGVPVELPDPADFKAR